MKEREGVGDGEESMVGIAILCFSDANSCSLWETLLVENVAIDMTRRGHGVRWNRILLNAWVDEIGVRKGEVQWAETEDECDLLKSDCIAVSSSGGGL